MIFETEDFRITHQPKTLKESYRVTLYVKGENPSVTGDIIARATTGERWVVVNHADNLLSIAPLEKGNLPQDMVGAWGIKLHAHIEK